MVLSEILHFVSSFFRHVLLLCYILHFTEKISRWNVEGAWKRVKIFIKCDRRSMRRNMNIVVVVQQKCEIMKCSARPNSQYQIQALRMRVE